jgi:hypothetical protein
MERLHALKDALHRAFTRASVAFLSLSPHHLALAMAVGMMGGLFPIPFCSTPPCLLLAFLVRLPAAGHIVVQGQASLSLCPSASLLGGGLSPGPPSQ